MAKEPIWAGSSSFATGQTPYGFYDSDTEFQSETDNFANCAARKLGYPIMDVEMQSGSFYACLEESVTEYSSQINQFNIKDNLLSLRGQSTGSSFTHKNITPTLGRNIRLSEEYGSEAGVGGLVSYKTGSILINSGSQTYDLDSLFTDTTGSGAIEVKRLFYEGTPAVQRYFDPYAGTGGGNINLLDQFGWGDYSPAIQFMMMPVYADVLRVQAIEFNDQVRKSAYSFEMRNNQLRIFPKPTDSYKLHFHYVDRSDRDNPLKTEYSGSATSVVSDFSNVPFDNMEFQHINHTGRQWIRKYGFSLSKELLGIIRSKYASIPIPGGEQTLDGETLRSEASTEKEMLITQLREILEQTSRRALLEADQEESQHLQDKLRKVPMPIYIG